MLPRHEPVAGLKFERDPLGLNEQGPCPCFECQMRRQIAQMTGVPFERVKLLPVQFIPASQWPGVAKHEARSTKSETNSKSEIQNAPDLRPPTSEPELPRELRGPEPEEAAFGYAAAPQITVFDTRRDGTPHVPQPRSQAPEVTTRSWSSAVRHWLALPLRLFRRLVLARPRLHENRHAQEE